MVYILQNLKATVKVIHLLLSTRIDMGSTGLAKQVLDLVGLPDCIRPQPSCKPRTLHTKVLCYWNREVGNQVDLFF